MLSKATACMIKPLVLNGSCREFKALPLSAVTKNGTSRLSTSASLHDKMKAGKVVFISQSSNVFANLAFEDWLYRNWSFEKRHVLFLCRNSPCVVIGKHQNPYVEANLPYLSQAEVPVARRLSGGGTVYHDDGNLNCTFFTPRETYCRRWNLELICRALREDFRINAEINKRDDLVVGADFKVSGSAAKLGRVTAYHHCTLLVNSDKKQLRLALKGRKDLKSRATESVPWPVTNLSILNNTLTVEKLLASVGKKYLEASVDGSEFVPQDSLERSDGFTLINPTDDWFPGLGALQEELSSWKMIHGCTPLFTDKRSITLPSFLALDTMVDIAVEAYHGLIKDVKVTSDNICPDIKELIEQEIGGAIKGAHYSPDIFDEIMTRMRLPRHLSSQRSVI